MSDPFLKSLTLLYQNKKLSAFDKVKEGAWREFHLPTREEAGFHHVRLSDFYAKEVNDFEPTETKKPIPNSLVFVNGCYFEELSDLKAFPSGMQCLPLSKAMRPFGSYLQSRFTKKNHDAFATLNTALFQEGLFVYLPPHCVVEPLIRIVHLYDRCKPFALYSPKIHLFAGVQAKASFFIHDQNEESSWCNSSLDFHLENEAHITCTFATFQNEKTSHTESFKASLQRQSQLQCFLFTNGGQMLRKDFHITLSDEEATCSLEGLWCLNGKREAHVNVFMDHAAPHTHSRQKFKGVLADVSRSSFEGKIFVRENALKTEGFQANHNLLLSDKAHAYTRPNLEIFADDVKASHGATCGSLNKEHLFYLKTRGLNEEEAKKLLVAGFLEEMVASLPSNVLQNEVRRLL